MKTLKECSPGELVVPHGYRFSAFVTQSNEKGRELILLMPGEVKWHSSQGGIRLVVSLKFDWEFHVDLWDQCTLGPSNSQKTTGSIGLYVQRSLMTLDGGRCCDLSTFDEVSKFPDNLGSQSASFGKWEIRTKVFHPAESQTLYAFSVPR
jgi:hypothetical protein